MEEAGESEKGNLGKNGPGSRVEQGVETIVKTMLPQETPRPHIGFDGGGDTPAKPYGRV